MKQDFQTSELKAELERGLGFGLRSLVRLDGASALNFRAERASDGLAFAVKCSPPWRRTMFERLVCHVEETKASKAVKRLFARECPPTFRGYHVICLAWCDGVRLFPDQLSREQLLAFLDDYREFSAALQKATGIADHEPLLDWRRGALENCRGLGGRWLARLIEREIPASEITYRAELLRTIHGDFHHGNFLFADGKVKGFFDLEEFCRGYPAEDVIRYFVCAAEHLAWFAQRRRRAILRRFADAVGHLPYSEHEWLLAIEGLLVRKLYMKTTGGLGLFKALNLLWRARLYVKMKRLAKGAR